jgi:HEAT repeat protein
MIGEPAVEFLIKALEGAHEHRWELVWALGEIKEEQAVPALIRALKDPDGEVRREAAWALWFTGDERASGPLKEALGENSALYEAELALGNIERRDTLNALRQALLARIEKAEKEAVESVRPYK